MRILALLLVSFAALAQEYPAKAVRIIVPFPPGGAADAMPRIVAEKLAEKWKQPFVIEHRVGASGSVGAELVSRAEPDGYTLLATPPAPLVINPFLYTKLGYDATQFTPVSVIGSIPSVMLVNPKVAANSVRDFVALAKENPGTLNYASQGTTTVSFLTTEMFLAAAGIKVTHIPYTGTGPALAATLAGETELFFDNLGASLAHVKSGRLKALAVCGERRHPALPDVPAMAEIYPGFVSVAWFGVLAPPRTPAAVADKLSVGLAEALKHPDVQKRLADLSAEPIGMGPREFAQYMQLEATRWREAIRFAGVKPE